MTACSSLQKRICVPPQFYPLHGHYASRSAQFSALPSPWVFTQGTQANLHASRIPGSALQNSQRTAPQASWIPKQIQRPFRSFRLPLQCTCALATPQTPGALEDPVTNPALLQFYSTVCWQGVCKEALYPTIGCLHSSLRSAASQYMLWRILN